MTCPVCGRRVRLTRDGRFAKHASHGATTCPNSRAEASLSGSRDAADELTALWDGPDYWEEGR